MKGRDMNKQKYAEGRIFDLAHLPPGFVAMGGWKNKRHHNALCKACANGSIRRIRYCRSAEDSVGQMYVFEEDANQVIRMSDARHEESPRKVSRRDPSGTTTCDHGLAATPGQVEAAVLAMCEINNGITLMQETLERLTAAVESIATPPKTPQQELVAAMSSNGFHN
jgi:hypothetical protein